MLTEHGTRVAPTTYYDAKNREKTARQIRDEELVAIIEAEREQKKFTRLYGARKMWLHLRGVCGVDVARCTVERLMRAQGWIGALRRKNVRTTIPDEAAARAADRVDRRFWASAPNRLWCADFTYVKTSTGTTYTAFIFDVFSRRIIGWMADTQMSTSLVLDALEMAVWTRRKEGVTDLTGLTHHNDAGSQYTSIAFTDRLIEAGVDASVGSVGDAYDNALAESQIGLYKTELINEFGPWKNRNAVEAATLDWVYWFNHERPHQSVHDLTPMQAERIYYTRQNQPHQQAG